MKFAKDKTVAIALILLLTVSAAIAVATAQFAVITYPPQVIDIPSFLFVTASPNPVGVGQYVAVGAMFSRPMATDDGNGGDFYDNVTIDIVDPDGVKTVYGPWITSRAAGIQFTFTPDQVGNYTIQAHYPGQKLIGDHRGSSEPAPSGWNLWLLNSTQLPADSNILTLVVQEEPVTPIYQTPPLPTEFWTRPIYATNWNWGELGANWFGIGGSGAYDAMGNVQPFGYAPNTAHIVWTKPTQFGGQPGSPISSDESTQYSSTSLLQMYFKPQCILNGILFYNKYASPNSNLIGWEAVDVHTGEELWSLPAGITGSETISYGQIVNYNNFQEFGSNAFLYSQPGGGGFGMMAGRWNGLYDAFTGTYLANITDMPSGSTGMLTNAWLVDYQADLQGAIIGYYTSGGNLCMYNTTKILCPPSFFGPAIFVRPSGTIDGSNPSFTEWSVPLPTTFGGDNISLSIAAVTPEVILMREVPYGTQWQGSNFGYSYDAGYDARTGNKLWGPINQTGIWPAYEDVSLLCVGDGYYVLHNKDTNQAYGFSLTNGKKVWGPVQLVGGSYSSIYRAGVIAYGRVYISDLGGYVNAIDLETGELEWTFYRGTSGYDTPFEGYPIFGYNTQSVADGKLFLTEGIMYTPPLHPSYRLAINCTDGTLVWKILQYACTCVGPIGDGYLISWNSFDNQIYSFGKGPSAMTVAASPAVSVDGDSVLVTGTVIDKSGGTKQDVITTRFPDGLPAMSDADQEAWMEYAYMQQIKPANATGVEVSISVLDPNDNVYEVGTTTSDDMGFYKLAFTPEVPGEYSIYATFSGSESYYGSNAETAINVESAPAATPAPTPTPAPMTDTYVLGIGAGAIIAIVIIGLVIILMLRKR
jgi:outer membrane protein assembly factor BamB